MAVKRKWQENRGGVSRPARIWASLRVRCQSVRLSFSLPVAAARVNVSSFSLEESGIKKIRNSSRSCSISTAHVEFSFRQNAL